MINEKFAKQDKTLVNSCVNLSPDLTSPQRIPLLSVSFNRGESKDTYLPLLVNNFDQSNCCILLRFTVSKIKSQLQSIWYTNINIIKENI